MTVSAQYLGVCKLGGSMRPHSQSPTVNIILSEESDIASYFVDISLMFASLIQLKILSCSLIFYYSLAI